MIVTRAPLRISLAGGGSDLPSFYENSYGEVLSLSINKYIYLAGHNFFSGGIRLSYSKTELVNEVTRIEHPLFRNAMLHLNFNEPIELSSFADVPGSGTGLGSSSAFTVALIQLLKSFSKSEVSKEELARLACVVELELCKDPIGKQDQYASAFGGINRIRFNQDGSVEVNSLKLDESKIKFLNSSLLLFHTGMERSASTILEEQISVMKGSDSAFESVTKIRDRVEKMESAIQNEDAHEMGALIAQSWKDKKSLVGSISNSKIEEILAWATDCGSLGGKLVGAGGGGFLLICVEPGQHQQFIEKFKLLRHLPFRLEAEGSSVVFNDESEL